MSSTIADVATTDANAYVFLCSENDRGGIVGIAWVDGTCEPTNFGRSSISEYVQNDIVTAAVSCNCIKRKLILFDSN